MTEEEQKHLEKRLLEYAICKLRGHQPSGMLLPTYPPWNVCKYCGTAFRYEQKLVELDPPKEDERPK